MPDTDDPSYKIVVLVPAKAGFPAAQKIMDAVADAAFRAQPDERDWDVFCYTVMETDRRQIGRTDG